MRRSVFYLVLIYSLVGCDSKVPSSKKGVELTSFFKTKTSGFFQPLAPDSTNIRFTNSFVESVNNSMYKFTYSIIHGGIGTGDFNNDGLVDLFFSSSEVANKLYLNKGNLKFEDISIKAGIDDSLRHSTGVTVVDINADGFDDIYVCRAGHHIDSVVPNLLYINNGDATFSEQGEAYGLNAVDFSTHANFFDADNDGDLDLYLVNFPGDERGKDRVDNFEVVEKGLNYTDRFYINQGKKRFVEVSKKAGINNHAHGLSASVADINNDGFLDIYVTNDFAAPDFIYLNNQKGGFKRLTDQVVGKMSKFAMGSSFGDINNDGLLDFISADVDYLNIVRRKSMRGGLRTSEQVTLRQSGFNLQYPRCVLQLNNGDGSFSEASLSLGVYGTDWSWSPLFMDFDNDGLKDIFMSNGFPLPHTLDGRALTKKLRTACRKEDEKLFNRTVKQVDKRVNIDPNVFFKNNGQKGFERLFSEGVSIPTISYGAVHADLDNDGDQDLVVNNLNQLSFIYENVQNTKNNWIGVSLSESSENTQSLGSIIRVFHGEKTQTRMMAAVKGYQSSSDIRQHFGLNKDRVDSIRIEWKNGFYSTIRNVPINEFITIHKDSVPLFKLQPKVPEPLYASAAKAPVFKFDHAENESKDYSIQLLLHQNLSDLGPGIAVGDLNGDNIDDVVFGSSFNHKPVAITQSAVSGAPAEQLLLPNLPNCEYSSPIILDVNGDQRNDILLFSGGYEKELDVANYQSVVLINNGDDSFKLDESFFNLEGKSISAVAFADINKNGMNEIFVANRLTPLQYPLNGESELLVKTKNGYKNKLDSLIPDFQHDLLTSVLWTDFNNDGQMDLITVGEWANIEFYQQQPTGRFSRVTGKTGLSKLNGFWNSITGGDFDNDGDIDFIVGNAGTNSRYLPNDGGPLEIHYGSFGELNTKTCFMSFVQDGKRYPVHNLFNLRRQYQSLNKNGLSFKELASMSPKELFGNEALENSLTKSVYETRSIFLENLGNSTFKDKPLPQQAQFSTLKGIVVWDLNEDGFLDVIAHGNNFNTTPDFNSQDASHGLVLLGKGDGTFKYVPAINSGFKSKLDARALALIEIDKQIGVFGTNNNGPSNLFYLNHTAFIRLPKNALYCQIKMKDGEMRKMEVYNGQGFLSQFPPIVSIPTGTTSILAYFKDGSSKELL